MVATGTFIESVFSDGSKMGHLGRLPLNLSLLIDNGR